MQIHCLLSQRFIRFFIIYKFRLISADVRNLTASSSTMRKVWTSITTKRRYLQATLLTPRKQQLLCSGLSLFWLRFNSNVADKLSKHLYHNLNSRYLNVCLFVFMCNRTQFKNFLPSFRTLLWRFFIVRAISHVRDFHFRYFSSDYAWVTILMINLLIKVLIFWIYSEDEEMRLTFFADKGFC